MWSAGVILYILLSGVPPFWGETEQQIFDAILKGQLDFQSDPWPRISKGAKDVVRIMLTQVVLGIMLQSFLAQCCIRNSPLERISRSATHRSAELDFGLKAGVHDNRTRRKERQQTRCSAIRGCVRTAQHPAHHWTTSF